MNVSEDVVAKLIKACEAQIERGHFSELYEGFNDCPAPQIDGSEDLSKCDCGIKEAAEALDAVRAEVAHD
jgi:hypothetical protein